jgi:hypothetical protein
LVEPRMQVAGFCIEAVCAKSSESVDVGSGPDIDIVPLLKPLCPVPGASISSIYIGRECTRTQSETDKEQCPKETIDKPIPGRS